MNRLLIAEKVAESWNGEGVSYAVANGLATYPDSLGRDLDVVMDRSQIGPAMNMARRVLESSGLTVARPPALWGERLLAVDTNLDDVLEIHVSERMSWRNVVLADHPHPSATVGPFRVDPWISIAKRVVAPLLAGHIHKLTESGRVYGASRAELNAAADRLPPLIGPALTTRLLESLRRRDVGDAIAIAAPMRRAAVRRGLLRRPITSIILLSHSFLRRAKQPFTPCAPIVALVGPDGVGKSTVLEALRTGDSLVFLDVVVRHWRPHLLPALGRLVGRSPRMPNEDGLYPPRRQPGRFSSLRLAYYYVDFLVGGFLKDRVDSSRQRLVLYDRCFLDMSVDPLRFGLASLRGTNMLWRWMPRPDLVILLEDDPQHIRIRKPELTTEEIRALYRVWEQHLAEGRVTLALPVAGGVDDVARLVRREIITAFMRKNGACLDETVNALHATASLDPGVHRASVV